MDANFSPEHLSQADAARIAARFGLVQIPGARYWTNGRGRTYSARDLRALAEDYELALDAAEVADIDAAFAVPLPRRHP